MEKVALLAALNIAKSSLGTADNVLPVLSHFCFMGDALYAYDDTTAIIVEIANGMHCALHGDTLVGLLEASSVEQVKIDVKQNGATLDVGTGKVVVPMLNEHDFVFTLPDEEPAFALPFTEETAAGFEMCLLSVGKDALKPEFNGVTVCVENGATSFYSSDNATASRYVPEKKTVGRMKEFAAVLPEEACAKFLKLRSAFGKDDAVKIQIGARGAVGTFTGQPVVTLFTKVLEAKPALFRGVFSQHADAATFFPVPDGFAAEVRKAAVLLARDSVKQCVIAFNAGKLSLTVDGTLGKMHTSIPVESQVNAAVCTGAEAVLRVLPHVDAMAVNHERSLVLRGDGFTHILSSRQGWSAAAATQPKPKPGGSKSVAEIEDDDIPF